MRQQFSLVEDNLLKMTEDLSIVSKEIEVEKSELDRVLTTKEDQDMCVGGRAPKL